MKKQQPLWLVLKDQIVSIEQSKIWASGLVGGLCLEVLSISDCMRATSVLHSSLLWSYLLHSLRMCFIGGVMTNAAAPYCTNVTLIGVLLYPSTQAWASQSLVCRSPTERSFSPSIVMNMWLDRLSKQTLALGLLKKVHESLRCGATLFCRL